MNLRSSGLALLMLIPASIQAATCEGLKSLSTESAAITFSETVPAGQFSLPATGRGAAQQNAAFKQLPAPAAAVFDLIVSSSGQTPVPGSSSLWGLINLGEDPTSLVFVNVLAEDCPSVRIALEPGEGLRFPRSGVLLGNDGPDRKQPDLLLVVRLPATPTPAPGPADLLRRGEIGGGGRPG